MLGLVGDHGIVDKYVVRSTFMYIYNSREFIRQRIKAGN